MTSADEPTSRELQRRQTRSQILQAAGTVFARAGFDAASLAEIAEVAGVKKALVQYHFSTKDQLWRDTAAHIWEQRNTHMAQSLAATDTRDALATMRRGFTALVEFTHEQPEWLWFMFHEAAGGGERQEWLVENCLKADYQTGESFVREFQDRGLIRQGPAMHLLHLISGALTYNLLVAPSTLLATGLDLGSRKSIDEQVSLLQELLAP